jgi:hypothetical protein
MSYPQDLDEIPTSKLRGELRDRRQARRTGKCDYCGRDPSMPSCKFPERHVKVNVKDILLLRFFKFLRQENRKPGVLADHEMLEIIKEFRKSPYA